MFSALGKWYFPYFSTASWYICAHLEVSSAFLSSFPNLLCFEVLESNLNKICHVGGKVQTFLVPPTHQPLSLQQTSPLPATGEFCVFNCQLNIVITICTRFCEFAALSKNSKLKGFSLRIYKRKGIFAAKGLQPLFFKMKAGSFENLIQRSFIKM